MPFWIASTNNIKVRGLFLDELDQIRCVAEILLWLHIRDNIPTQGQDFLYPNLIQVCNGFSNLVLSQIDGWQVGNSWIAKSFWIKSAKRTVVSLILNLLLLAVTLIK